MADLKSTIVNGKLRVTSDANVSGNLEGATISENGTSLSDKYLGKTATAADSSKLGGTAAASYAKLASPALTGTPTAPTAASGTNTTQIATTAFVMDAFKANDAMVYKGVVNANSDLPATHYQGWTYKVATAGAYAGKTCEVGDMIICQTDGTSANNDHWTVIQTNVDGAVTGPASAVADRVAVFNGTTGKIIKDSGFTLESKTAASGGTALSLVTTGEKATWNGKQSALSSQTAYSAKGSATKVPQITTNSLGQVTSIAEVDIKTDIVIGHSNNWTAKTWNNFTSFDGQSNIWSDGKNIYCSYGANQYVLNRFTSTWETKTWSGLDEFYATNIWTDGKDIYYSTSEIQKVLNKNTNTWVNKSWNGYTSVAGQRVWTDGTNFYYSVNNNTQYKLNKSTNTWEAYVWGGTLQNIDGLNIWTDGNDIYYSNSFMQYVLNKETSAWEAKTWSGKPENFYGKNVWTDGENIYYSNANAHHILNKSTGAWETTTWTGRTSFNGQSVWTDGVYFYYSNYSTQYSLDPITTSTDNLPKVAGTGNYNDLHNKPEVMSQSEFDNATGGATPSGINPIIDLVYPIGAIYMSVNSTSPATLFGGSWTQLKDRFLLGAGDTYSNGATGGSATHEHLLPIGINSSYLMIYRDYLVSETGERKNVNYNSTSTGQITPDYRFESSGASSMPPYLAVFIWKRVA